MNERPDPSKVRDGLTTKSAQIRALAAAGYKTSEIATIIGVRYQHAYNVLKDARGHPSEELPTEKLLDLGFQENGEWVVETDGIRLEATLPKGAAIYAFAVGKHIHYVGSASIGLYRRMRSYARPGRRQGTSIRLKQLIRNELDEGRRVKLLAIIPGEIEWQGLPVDLAVGIEAGLIHRYQLPWNKQGN